MKFTNGNSGELKRKFWEAMDDSPFLMLQLDSDPSTAVPMPPQLDRNADSALWFFTQRTGSFARLGPATATFQSKGYDLFARFDGTLEVETNEKRLDQFWSNFVAAWYSGGRNDPDLLFLRMNLRSAEIWNSNLGILNTAKMAMGLNVEEAAATRHAAVAL